MAEVFYIESVLAVPPPISRILRLSPLFLNTLFMNDCSNADVYFPILTSQMCVKYQS